MDKTIQFHDPTGSWSSLKDSFHLVSNSKWSDWKDEHLAITIDVKNDGARYTNIDRNVDCLFEEDSTKALLDSCDCAPYNGWTKDFYTYIWGLPMKLKDPNIKVTEQPNKIIFFEDSCFVLQVQYPNENWEYYISSEDYYLAGFRFEKIDGSGGEIVRNVGVEQWGKIITPKKRIWFDLKENLLGTDVFSTK